MRSSRDANTPDLQPRPSASSSLARLSLPVKKKASSGVRSSTTWTSTSGDLGGLSDTDEIRERDDFEEEYNRIAKKYGIRSLVPDNPDDSEASGILQKRGWWSRTFRKTSSQSTEHSIHRQRSSSHIMSHLAHPKRDSLKDQDLQGLVRLCGKSFLYLPPEYAPGSLILPTCFRATAQYLVQHAPETRGVFRIPGSIRIVNELYEFYCAEQSVDVASTVRSPNLPAHINAGVHDVASCFKKFLSGLPGGILGSLSLFDAMIAINSQLYGDPEFNRTKQSKIRARLIALAIGTLRSQFRRELICAVFGLLCLLGRAAETAPREDEFGRPLPTSDLMGYNALGIVFGPLLVGDMLGSYAVKLADPSSGLFIVPRSPSSSRSQKGKKKAKEPTEEHGQPPFLDVDKIHVANNITEMLITNWRDVVRQMRSLDTTLGALRSRSPSRSSISISNIRRRRSSSFGRNSEIGPVGPFAPEAYADDCLQPTVRNTESDSRPSGRYIGDRHARAGASGSRAVSFRQIDSTNDALSVKKTRPNSLRNVSSTRPNSGQIGALTSPREESDGEENEVHPVLRFTTPLKSSLKSSPSKKVSDFPNCRDQTGDENTIPESNGTSPPPPPRSPSRVAGGISPIKRHFESLEAQPRPQNISPSPSSDTRRPEHDRPRSRATQVSKGTLTPEFVQVDQPVTPASTQILGQGYDQIRQCAKPSHIETCSSEYDQPRPESKKAMSETLKTKYSYRDTPTRSDGSRSAYDQSRTRFMPNSTETPKSRTEYGTGYAGNDCSHRYTSLSSSLHDLRSTAPRALTQVDGSPERYAQKPSCDLDPMVAYQSGPELKILKAPSTMRLQAKVSHTDPKVAAAKLRSSVWRTSSRGSADLAIQSENEPVKKSLSGSKPERAAADQMDGAVDFIISVPSPLESFFDLRGEFERRGVKDSQLSTPPVLKSRSKMHTVLTKMNGQKKKPSGTSPSTRYTNSNFTTPGGVNSGANKVLGLAAIFDTAAKASHFVPTPGGAIYKKRNETAGVISPYTSNPSPRASLQSVTSVSTPISLMNPTRLSIHLSTPAKNSGKKSMIPRLQFASASCSTTKTERHMSPEPVLRRDESSYSGRSSNSPSRFSTPSRLPVKKMSTHESPLLPQFDGLNGTKKSLLKLTGQQEIRPVGFHSSSNPQVSAGYRGMLRSSQQSTSSEHSEDTVLSRELGSISLTRSLGRSASSLRDQIRSLRIELSAKNEDCTQIRLALEESRKMKRVSESLLRQDLARAKADTEQWRRRAERAERTVHKYERLAVQIKDERDHEPARHEYLREQQGGTADDYSFMSGSEHLATSDRATSQPLTARMNQSIRRTLPVGAYGANSFGNVDGFSECSSSTVVRTVVAPDENDPLSRSGLWDAVNELVDVDSPGFLEESLPACR